MPSAQPIPLSVPSGVGSTMRVYVVFSTHEEWYHPIVRWGIKRYQGYTPKYTHCFLIVQNILTKNLNWFEVEFNSTPSVWNVEYSTLNYTDGSLDMVLYGDDYEPVPLTLDALDVTFYLLETCTDPYARYLEIGNRYKPLTLLSLIGHIVPYSLQRFFPEAWTCSGHTGALIGQESAQAFWLPYTPDQLCKYVQKLLAR